MNFVLGIVIVYLTIGIIGAIILRLTENIHYWRMAMFAITWLPEVIEAVIRR